jgi:predicted metal-dependent phosphoesterase TrpH
MVDLHSHSTCSDGSLSPGALVARAAGLGLSALALTDHDTLSGLPEAAEAARAAGLRFIPGVEIEISFSVGEFHLLGLGLRDCPAGLETRLKYIQAERCQRNREIIRKMTEDGLPVSLGEVTALSGGQIVSRLHFAQVLVSRGLCKSIETAFARFLTPGQPYFAEKKALALAEAADLIHTAGGKAVLAHPHTLRLGWAALEKRLAQFKEEGLDGLEAWHSNATLRECRRLEKLAAKMGLLVTAGSDFHGDSMRGRRLGRSCEGLPIEDRFAEAIPG